MSYRPYLGKSIRQIKARIIDIEIQTAGMVTGQVFLDLCNEYDALIEELEHRERSQRMVDLIPNR